MYEIHLENPIHVYFIGIGGVSMSGLAHILADRRFTVSGSDLKHSEMTDFLEKEGVNVLYGQRRENLTEQEKPVDLVVYTAAIHPDNPEYAAAKELNIPMLTRAELLGQIMRGYEKSIAIAGTHGKTTTTSMLSAILLEAGVDPTLMIGGVYDAIGGNIRVGHSSYFVTEACEYTNSFLSFCPKIGVILNIEEDHLDFFKDLADIRHSFRKFAELLPRDGALIIHETIPDIEEITKDLPCQVITFGGELPEGFTLRVPGDHNRDNALAALAAADLLKIPRETSAKALAAFRGAERRFEYKGTFGDGITVVDDYAHHPTEIRAALTAAASLKDHDRVVCVFQPHTYSRTKALLDEFADALLMADVLVLAEVYAAREVPSDGVTSEALKDAVLSRGKDCVFLPTFGEIENWLRENCTKGDLLITMGAGDVVNIGEDLLAG